MESANDYYIKVSLAGLFTNHPHTKRPSRLIYSSVWCSAVTHSWKAAAGEIGLPVGCTGPEHQAGAGRPETQMSLCRLDPVVALCWRNPPGWRSPLEGNEPVKHKIPHIRASNPP